MSDQKKELRNRWLHLRLNDSEYTILIGLWKKATPQCLSEYARKVLLQKPIHIYYRNGAADDLLSEMIRMKNELSAIGNNFNQAVHRLHTLDKTSEVKAWLIVNEKLKFSLLEKTEAIKLRLTQIYDLWSSK
jgi:hypothetical protein